jgi:pimeloyl-ACP methyl ester carboxylesterase
VQRGLLVSHLEAAGTPILLVHGLIDNRSIFALLRRGLTRRGFGSVYSMNYSPLTADIRTSAAQLGEEVEAIVAETGYEKIHVVGHSLGGLIARYYVTRLGGDARVHTLVTLGTPHQGTWSGYALPTRITAQMRPGSGLIRELDEPAPGCTTRFISYWSDTDLVIVPQGNGALRHPDLWVRNVRLHGVGHISLPIVGDVAHGISMALAELDQHGSTVTAGVTPLAPRAKAPAATMPGRQRAAARSTASRRV